MLRTKHKDVLKAHDYMKKDYVIIVKKAYLTQKDVLLDFAARSSRYKQKLPQQRSKTYQFE